MSLITDPIFYLVAIPAVLLFGIAKGGFGGSIGVAAVPLMSLAVSPVQAAAILLPILCLMDIFSVWAFRGRWDWAELRVLLPAALTGIALGSLAFGYLSVDWIRLALGIIVIAFMADQWLNRGSRETGGTELPRGAGLAAGGAAGFTSFVAHAGGPPLSMYLLNRPLDRTTFVGTSVIFFIVVNYAKLVPYAWLGQLDGSNLATSAVLAPLAPFGVWLGVWMHRTVSDRFFFQVVYLLLFVVGLKLVYDGAVGLAA